MNKGAFLLSSLLVTLTLAAEVPSNLVVDGVPDFPPDLVQRARPYFDFRSATMADWHPERAEMTIRTRFSETSQIHYVKMPGGARRQLTFFDDTVGGGTFRPGDPSSIFLTKDVGGNEFFQIYRMDLGSGALTLLTDGKSRNALNVFSRDGKTLAFTSTRRTGNDTDIWIMDPTKPDSARILMQVEGGGWAATDFTRDGKKMLVSNYRSANDSDIYLVDVASGTRTLLTQKKPGEQVAFSEAWFSAEEKDIYFTSDRGGEFKQIYRMSLSDGTTTALTSGKWDVDDVSLSRDRGRLAWTTNENGAAVLHAIDVRSGKAFPLPKLPFAVIGSLRWHDKLPLLGLTITSARSATDVYSIDVTNGTLTRWTESETGGLNPELNAEPELVTVTSFDGTPVSAFYYRPDPGKFPGKRPVIVNIHGGPEGQSRPQFLGRNNYWINELGIGILFPNVRGSEGYGKTFLAADNGFKREDSVKDIGALLDWLRADGRTDAERVAVYGGSYGGYMVLASMQHFADKLRAGIDVVGISDFVTFLNNTSGYRRDLRRVEYGDEREAAMKAHLDTISPLKNASKITDPLFVIMGFNDPRVPYTEGEQIVKQVRANGVPVWYLLAKDEGHGYAKRKNQDFQFIAMTMFWEQNLLK